MANEEAQDLETEETTDEVVEEGISQQDANDFSFEGVAPPNEDESEQESEEASSDSDDQETQDSEADDTSQQEETETDENSDDSSESSDETDDSDQESSEEEIVDIDDLLQELSGGRYSTEQELQEALNELDTLREAASKPPEIQFDSVAKQRMYEFVSKHGNGENPQVANTYLTLVNQDFKTMDEKDVLFAKFRADHPDIPESQARTIHDERMAEEYSSESLESARKKFEYDEEVKKARESLTNLQKEHVEGIPETEEQQAEQQVVDEAAQQAIVKEQIEGAIGDYKGFSLGFKINEKGDLEMAEIDPSKPLDSFTFEIDQAQSDAVKANALDPEFWNKMLQGDDGKVDWGKYFNQVTFATNQEQILQAAAQFGYNKAKVHLEKSMGNRPDPPKHGKKPDTKGEESLYDAVSKAIDGQ